MTDNINSETIALRVIESLKDQLLLSDHFEQNGKPKRDYAPSDIRAMTGVSSTRLSRMKLHGEYHINGKRLFRREEIDYRRRMGLNLVMEEK